MSKRTTTRERQGRRAEEKSGKKDAPPRKAKGSSTARGKPEPAKAEKRGPKTKPAEAKKRGAKRDGDSKNRKAKAEPAKAKAEPPKAKTEPPKAKKANRPRPRAVPDLPEVVDETSTLSPGGVIEVTEHDLL